MAAPEQGPPLAVALCNYFNFNSDCATMFGPLGLGGVVTQVVANADVGGLDGQVCTFIYVHAIHNIWMQMLIRSHVQIWL